MGNKAAKYTAGLAVAALLVGGGYYMGSQRVSQDNGPLPAETAGMPEPVASAATPTPSATSASSPNASDSVQSPHIEPGIPQGAERTRRDKIVAELTRAFELDMAAYFKAVTAAHPGEKIAWCHYISANPSLSEADRERNKAIWEKYYALCEKHSELKVPFLPRMRFYTKFFDIESFGLAPEKLSILPFQDEYDMVPFGYITEVVNPAWYAEYVQVPNDFDFRSEKAQKDMPAHLRAYMSNPQDAISYETIPVQGVRHLDGYNKGRAADFGGDTLKVLSRHMDLKGKDLADIGSGCGFTLPMFREAIGPNARLMAGDMDMYTVDVLKYTSRGTGAEIIQNLQTDCRCGENAFDIVNMTGVHLGLLCSNPSRPLIEEKVLPWLRSIAKALRPGGLLSIHDGEWGLVERHADKIVEEAGFKKIDEYVCHEKSAFVWIFKVKK